jgi:hemoglobin/transferrin/lactoferrin receptor protein
LKGKPVQLRSRIGAAVRRKPLVVLMQAVLCGAVTMPPAHAQGSAQHAARSYQVPAGTLEDALNSFARQAGITLSFSPSLVQGKQSTGLRGEFSVGEALHRLLSPYRLEAVRSADGNFSLRELAVTGRHELPEVRVTAAPDSGEQGMVRAATLERYQARDLEDIFATQSEVTVGGGHGIAQKVYVRGIEDMMLNVSIDGATQAAQAFHHAGRIQIEPELLNRVEVQSGTGDATAGAGALGGAIRFVTKDPAEMLREGQRVGALLKAEGFSNGNGYKGNASVYGHLSDQWSAMFSQTSQDVDDYKDGGGKTVSNTAAKQTSTFAKLVGKLTPDQTLRISYDRFTDKGTRTQRPQWVESGFNPAYSMESKRETWTASYNWKPDNTLYDLKFTVYQTTSELEQNVYDRWGLYTGTVQSTGLDLRNTSRFGMHTLTYGLDHRRDHMSAGYNSIDPEMEGEVGKVNGLYIQDSMALTQNLIFNLGGRYDSYRLSDNANQKFSDSGFSPNASLRFNVTPALALLAGHARALRGPKVRDAYKLEGSANDPNMQAEKARTSEVGAEYAEGALRLSGKLFRTNIDNAIADPLYGPVIWTNVGDMKSDGAVLFAGYDFERVSMSASINHTDATIDGRQLNTYDHNGLGTSLGDRLITTVDYRHTAFWTLGWLGRFVRGVDNLETSAGVVDKPGYAVHDVYARWRPTGKDDYIITLTVKNLFDKDYLDQASNENFQRIPGYEGIVGSREPGREIRLGLAVRF